MRKGLRRPAQKALAMDELSSALQRHFGHDAFIPPQEEIVADLLAGKDVFALLPTGAGKSLCYQLPALLMDGLSIVVSPLIALMKDQVDALLMRGISASCLHSGMGYSEMQAERKRLQEGKIKILYLAPERILIPEFLGFLETLNVSLIAVDEAHCISEWGHEFRPAYRQLRTLRERFPEVPTIALTATAIQGVQREIIDLLGLVRPRIYKASFNRPNLFYQVKPKDEGLDHLRSFMRERRGQSGIVYCLSQKSTEQVATWLQHQGHVALPYHAGLDPHVREKTQNSFIRGEVNVVVATIAFGMGIDKPDIRFVVHHDLPKDLESYYQETGRAGRDGLPSDCLLLFRAGDRWKMEYLISQGADEVKRRIALRKFQEMVGFCKTRGCRRKALLAYFGESLETANCGGCDNCTGTGLAVEAEVAPRRVQRKRSPRVRRKE